MSRLSECVIAERDSGNILLLSDFKLDWVYSSIPSPSCPIFKIYSNFSLITHF
jgi:hypothetical protein